MASYAMRGFRSRRTFFRSFVPPHANGVRGGMGGLLKVAFLGTCTYFIVKKLSLYARYPICCPIIPIDT